MDIKYFNKGRREFRKDSMEAKKILKKRKMLGLAKLDNICNNSCINSFIPKDKNYLCKSVFYPLNQFFSALAEKRR